MWKRGRPEEYTELERYLDQHFEGPDLSSGDELAEPAPHELSTDLYKSSGETFGNSPVSLEDLIRETGESFHQMLMRRIRESGLSDAEVYRRASLDRRLFSKIRNNPAYHPGKDTVIALALALKMNLPETEDFLARAEYAFSPHSRRDLIIQYYLEKGVYDIDLINTALDNHGLPALGSV